MTKTKEEIIKKWIYDTPLIPLKKAVGEAMEEYRQTNSIESLIDRNYNAQIRREQITPDTTFSDFKLKIHEELKELSNSYYENNNFDPKELIDIILVCFSMAEHFNINIMQVLSDKVEYNEKRED